MSTTQNFVMSKLGKLVKRSTGWFLECQTDIGVVAVWGSKSNRRNIDTVHGVEVPCRVRADESRTPNQNYPQHSWWIPETARLTITPMDSTAGKPPVREADITKPGSESGDALKDVPPILYIVNCTEHKVWRDDKAAPPYVQALEAYRGQSVMRWRQRAEYRRGERWLFLSAKYGFIEPEHPVSHYNVTFKNPATGPIGDESLASQVLHQTRWPERVPLRDFRTVYVYSNAPEYLENIRLAFATLGAVVKRLED